MFSTLTAPFKIGTRIIFDYEIILVTDGECKITIDNVAYICKKNDVVFIKPGVEHKFECINNSNFVQPHIHFDVSYNAKSEETYISFKPQKKMTPYELSLISEDVFKEIAIPYVFKPSNMDKFKKKFFEIIEIFQSKSYNYELLYKAKMLELLDCILTQFDSSKITSKEVIHNPVMAVKNYIDNNYLSVITLDSLAKQFYYNKYTLMRKFKTMYGQNIISYYHNKRVEYIKTILSETSLPITTLAEKLNFSDIYSLSRFFKTHVGCSPTAYRKNHFVN